MVTWNTRPYREGDDERMAATVTACFRADGLEIVIGAAEIAADFTRMGVDVQRGILVVDGPAVEGSARWVAAGVWLAWGEG